MSDASTDATEEAPAALPGDGLREGIVDGLRAALGDQLIDTHLVPQTDLWVRVTADVWPATAAALKAQGFEYFCFLSAIDWLPSPYGKGEDDPSDADDDADDGEPAAMTSGYAGGDSRFQIFGRLTDIRRHVGVTIKADVPESMTIGSWIPSFAGANWHERETHEMFGIVFEGHPDLRNLYLPGEFEGFPLRKDFPLLARMVKPWPGIVDVEPMPAEDDAASEPTADTAAGDAVEAATESPTADAAPSTTDESADATVVDTPPTDDDAAATTDETTAGSDAESTEVGEAVTAADATPDAVEPEPTTDETADAPSDAVTAPEPAPADASETDRAELAEDAAEADEAAPNDAVNADGSDADAGTVPADLGPGTTTESTDADAEAPTPGPPTEAHPDGLTPGDADDESGDQA